MDFAAALANLEKTAQAAANSTSTSNNHNNSNQRRDDDRRRGRPEQWNDQRRNQRPRHNDHNDGRDRGRDRNLDMRPLEEMSRFGYRVAPYQSPAPSPTLPDAAPTTPKHIALLVICIDELPYEHIWKAWATTTGDAMVSILVHAKYPGMVQSSWLRQRLLVRPPRIGRGNCYADPVYLSHAPEWGSVQITSAMVELVAAGLKIGPNDRESDERFSSRRFLVETTKDVSNSNNSKTDQEKETKAIPPVDKFIFVSETCLPVKTLKECQEALFEEMKAAAETKGSEAKQAATNTSGTEDTKAAVETNGNVDTNAAAKTKGDDTKVSSVVPTARPNEVSWINARNRNTPGTPQNKYERDQFQDINRMVPQACRWKADQWTVLSRAHAAAVLNIDQHMRPADQLWNSFARINASDEMYFPTALSILGILKGEDDSTTTVASLPPQVAKRAVTYTDWTEGMRNPATYTNGIRDFNRVAKIARKQGCLFARKFALVHAIPGKEKVVTGAIDVDAWKKAIDVLQKAEESS